MENKYSNTIKLLKYHIHSHKEIINNPMCTQYLKEQLEICIEEYKKVIDILTDLDK